MKTLPYIVLILAGEEAELQLWEVQVGKTIAPEMMLK